jgi:hypothetical protein
LVIRVVVRHPQLPFERIEQIKNATRLHIGSGEGDEVRLDGDGIAPHHCELVRQGNHTVLRALDGPVQVTAGERLEPGAACIVDWRSFTIAGYEISASVED